MSGCGSLFARGVQQKSATCVKLVPTAATAIATATATATAVTAATAIANATATARTAEFYNWILTGILRGMLPDMLIHIAVRLLCRDNFI